MSANCPGIKLRVGDDWHFRLLKDMYKTTNEVRDCGGGGGGGAIALPLGLGSLGPP